jgi:hypothetical protein
LAFKDENSKMKIRIATPMHGGNAKSVYITSITDLVGELTRAGHTVEQMSLTNESLITRARNTLTHSFLSSNCDALLFIDNDHRFDAKDVVKLVESGKDVIGAICPMKGINWDGVRRAALAGKENLELYSGLFAVNVLGGTQTFQAHEPIKVLDIGTGMMFITRRVFELLKPVCKSYINNSYTNIIPFGERVIEYFTTAINEQETLLSEDYAFCAMWRSLGNDVWAAPWVKITHAGDYEFAGSFLHGLQLGN